MSGFPEIEASSVVEKAREYLGTPWHHGARVKGVGIDCIGLVVEVYRELGVPVADVASYTLDDEFELLVAGLEAHCDQLVPEEFWPGDILVFRGRLMYNHVGLYNGEGGMIHAYSSPTFMSVCEQPLDDSWLTERLVAVYRYKEARWRR